MSEFGLVRCVRYGGIADLQTIADSDPARCKQAFKRHDIRIRPSVAQHQCQNSGSAACTVVQSEFIVNVSL